MSEIKILSDVAGRVCAIVRAAGESVADGDEIVMIEAMKMEIPASATSAGRVKQVLVKIDDMITEGQAVAIIEG
jgi:biotin carboxyl carrier protein